MTAAGGDRGDNTALNMDSLRDAFDWSDTDPVPAADRQTDEERFDLGTEADRVAALYADADQEDLAQGIYASLVNLYEHLARPAAVMADLGAAITEGVTAAGLREVVAEGLRDVLAGCEEWPTGLELADAVLALPEMRALIDAAAKVQRAAVPRQLSDCTCDAFALIAEHHRASCPIGASWAVRAALGAEG